MNTKGFKILTLIVLVSILQSCSMMAKSPKVFVVRMFIANNQNLPSEIWRSDYLYYDSTGALEHEKSIYRNSDSLKYNVSVSLGNLDQSCNSFSATWEKISPVEITKQTTSQVGYPPDVFYLDHFSETDSFLPKDESLSFAYYFSDPIEKYTYNFDFESDGGRTSLNELTIIHDDDSISYERILRISPEIIDYFRQMKSSYSDSVEFTAIPKMPNVTNCTLNESHYSIIESCNNPLGNKKATYIDSTFENGVWEVNRKEEFYFLYKEIAVDGGYKQRKFTSTTYSETHVLANEVSPYYELKYNLAPNGMDTLFKSELSVSKSGRLYCYKIVQKGQLTQRKGSKLPIVKREMYFWFNPRKSKIVRKRYVAYTEQNHQLVKEWRTLKSYKMIQEIETIPDVSGNQQYEVVPNDFYLPQYPYFNSLSSGKERKSGKSDHYYNRKMIKNLRERTIELERNRKAGYEKRIAVNTFELFEIYYFK